MTRHTRTLVMGDPQAPLAKVLEVLDANRALDGDRLASDVVLVSVGDHFDYDLDDPEGAGAEGLRVLGWLASHDRDQVRILFGNHDAARVMELITLDDTRFAQARALARTILATGRDQGWDAAERLYEAEFVWRFPDVPTPGLAARDYASFSEAQRALVIDLLLSDRFELALVGELADGRHTLVSHAGVTRRELALLGMDDERDPRALAAALQRRFRDAIDARRDDWRRGVLTPMSLEPLYIAGKNGAEGGGLLYHRPHRGDRPGAKPEWERDPERPRRFDPRALPAGMLQLVGHTGHHKSRVELGDAWLTDAARQRERGGIRTLRVHDGAVTYDVGALPAQDGATDLFLVDGEMWRVPADEYPLFPLARVLAPL